MNIPLLDSQKILENLKSRHNPFWPQYHAYYSTWLGGITTDPALMMLPMDDHMVHRGDGVFEAIKTVDRHVFLITPHLERLARSAASIGLKLPFEIPEIQSILLQTLKVANQPNVLIRLFVSRGPGGYTTNPYDSVASQMYVTITDLRTPKLELYTNGVKIGRSLIPVKESWMAQVKSCNYLPNVMMKKESVDRSLDFTVAFDDDGFLAESSTENIAIVDSQGVLVHPKFENILRGTTMIRVFDLARTVGMKTDQRNLTESDLLSAREVMMIGTTLDVLPVTSYEGKSIGSGVVGPIAAELRQVLSRDFSQGPSF